MCVCVCVCVYVYVCVCVYKYVYTNLGFEDSHEYLSGGSELTNGEVVQKIKLAKWRLIGIIFHWEVDSSW